jgi:hypothetical protein
MTPDSTASGVDVSLRMSIGGARSHAQKPDFKYAVYEGSRGNLRRGRWTGAARARRHREPPRVYLAGTTIQKVTVPRGYATAYRRRYFTATVKSFGHGAVMVTVSPVMG